MATPAPRTPITPAASCRTSRILGDEVDMSAEEKTIIDGEAGHQRRHEMASVDVPPDSEELEKEKTAWDDDFPDGGLRAWLVVAGGVCVTFGTFGFVNTWGVFQAYYQETILSDVAPSTIAWIGSIQYALVFLPGLITGRMFDLGHYRIPQISATVLLLVAAFLTPECKTYWQFLLCQGVAIGLACGFLFGPTIAVISHWFRARRGLAFGILASGSSIGGTVLPITVRKLIPIVGFKWAMRITAFILLAVLTTAVLTLRRRLPPKNVSGGLLNLKAFRYLPYSLYVAASLVSFLGLYTGKYGSSLLTYLEVYGTEIGVSSEFAFYLIPIANATSLIGRVGSGLLTDRFGPLNTLIPCTLVAGIVTFAWPFARSLGSLVVVACIYGIACGVFVGMLPAPVTRMGETEDVGRRSGMLMTVVAAGAVAGPPISGAIRDTTGSFVGVGYYAGGLRVSKLLGSMIVLCVLMMVGVKYASTGKLTGKL
ncbi:hypothetical protein FRC10_007808 [Ceratobasidium sp. 414]|nr:hypothetical protein FRC10_007808 [Ceratobasidium sp. 414]